MGVKEDWAALAAKAEKFDLQAGAAWVEEMPTFEGRLIRNRHPEIFTHVAAVDVYCGPRARRSAGIDANRHEPIILADGTLGCVWCGRALEPANFERTIWATRNLISEEEELW